MGHSGSLQPGEAGAYVLYLDERNLRQESEERSIPSSLPLSRASQTLGSKPLVSVSQNSRKERETLNLDSPPGAHG